MNVKAAVCLGLFFIVTVKSDVRYPDFPKTCESPQQASGGSLSEMVGSVFAQCVVSIKKNIF